MTKPVEQQQGMTSDGYPVPWWGERSVAAVEHERLARREEGGEMQGEQQQREWSRALEGSEIEHGPDCQPSDMTEPDEEGVRDCLRCGLFEYPQRLNA